MAYSQGGLIAATDYNTFVGGNPATGSGSINAVWATGNGRYGYGQTALSQAAATGGTVTATQWATLINTLNSVNTHQTGSGTGIAATTSGSLITYLSTLSTSIGTIYTNHNSFVSQGSTTTGSVFSASATATNDASYANTIFTRSINFSSGNAARYFFNAGGQLNFVITSVTNNDGTARSADAVTVIGTNLGGVTAIRGTTSGGRTGTGGTVTTNNTGTGYYGLTTSPVVYQNITSSSGTYSGDSTQFYMSVNGSNVSGNGDNGSVITFYLNYLSSHTSGFNDTLNITVNHRVDVVYPESTNLTNSWGTVTIG